MVFLCCNIYFFVVEKRHNAVPARRISQLDPIDCRPMPEFKSNTPPPSMKEPRNKFVLQPIKNDYKWILIIYLFKFIEFLFATYIFNDIIGVFSV